MLISKISTLNTPPPKKPMECLWSVQGEECIQFLYTANPQLDDPWFSGQGTSGGSQTLNIRGPADLRADSPSTVPP
ncbi:hypothetical protein PoB_004930800 [Plakobranchus ocellatus]|uniref:Uncharacterized protein n=1 Tax=Plakobranchus ocellatus TaxID=259542 RepID=A0AAV4BUE9_9GAST|nr:hypothetical protein PoB_004930800 [Plakobranchus ocellatus]